MNKKNSILQKEIDSTFVFYLFFLVLLVTGWVGWFSNYNIFSQWSYIYHTAFGLVGSYYLIRYSVLHIKRTLGVRRIKVIVSGYILFVIMLMMVLTGGGLAFLGQEKEFKWHYDFHFYLSLVLLIVAVFHLLFFLNNSNKGEVKKESRFLSLGGIKASGLVLMLILIFLSLVGVCFFYSIVYTAYTGELSVEAYEYPYGTNPFRPSQTETSSGGFVYPSQIANSDDCSTCHQEIADQWYRSAHRQAASDPAYVTNINLLVSNKGISAARYCEGCHAPVALLTGQLSPGGEHGGVKGSIGHREGVNCMSCHGIQRVVHLQGVASYEYKPASQYLFEGSDNFILSSIRHFLIRVQPDAHIKEMSRPVLKDSSVCATCHAQFMDANLNQYGWVKMQDEYSAWLNSAYSGGSGQSFSHSENVRCHDCHMPKVVAKDPSANEDGEVSSHFFYGANTMLAIHNDDVQHLNNTIAFLQKNKMKVVIDPPRRDDAVQNTKAIDESIRGHKEFPFFFYLGELVQLDVVVSNIGVGHNFPGGSIDLNEAWLHLRVVDAAGELIFESGSIDTYKQVDPQSHFYRSVPINAKGEHVWKHDLFNMVGEVYRNVIPSGEADIASYQWSVPAWARSPLTVVASLKYKKLNERYARWALKEQYVDIPVVEVAYDTLSIPLVDKRPVVDTKEVLDNSPEK